MFDLASAPEKASVRPGDRFEREAEVTSQAQHRNQPDAHRVPAVSLHDRQQVHDNRSFGIDPS